jgi:hypothetical protein
MMPCRLAVTDVLEGFAASVFKFVQLKKSLTELAVLLESYEQYLHCAVLPEK